MTTSIVAAVTDNFALGYEGNLIHHDPVDMKFFKELTTNNVVIMGSKTYESLPNGALPNRVNIVVSRHKSYPELGFTTPICIDDAIDLAKNNYPDKDIFIIGGAQIYNYVMKHRFVDGAYLTKFNFTAKKADTYLDEGLFFETFTPKKIINTTTTEVAPGKLVLMRTIYYKKKR